MKMNISHPYKDNILLSFGQFTQIVGQDQQLKYYIWQILLWYFGGKKYSEEDLVLFEQNEPKILIDDTVVSRSEFSVIQISNINDLIEQMEYKKGSVAYDYLKKKINSTKIIEQIENIKTRILTALEEVIDPELGIDIVNLGLIYEIRFDGDTGQTEIDMTLTTMGCPLADLLTDQIYDAMTEVPEVTDTEVKLVWYPAWTVEKMSRYARIALGIK